MSKKSGIVVDRVFINIESALDSLRFEVLKGNKVVIFKENNHFHTIVRRESE